MEQHLSPQCLPLYLRRAFLHHASKPSDTSGFISKQTTTGVTIRRQIGIAVRMMARRLVEVVRAGARV